VSSRASPTLKSGLPGPSADRATGLARIAEALAAHCRNAATYVTAALQHGELAVQALAFFRGLGAKEDLAVLHAQHRHVRARRAL
jgi:hypothetical protein